MQVDLRYKVAVVTGSSRGIGRAIAEAFAAAGARVWFHGTSDEGRAVADAVGQPYVRADFTKPDQVQTMAETIFAQEKRLDILVNNAGIEPIMPLDAIDFSKYEACFNVNVRAAVQLTSALLPLLKVSGAARFSGPGNGGASVINITSIHDSVPYPHNAVYSMTKAALNMFTRRRRSSLRRTAFA
jgi:gluconate 5-dehydrogenase